ncbi:hypothetical protein ABT063_23000 [Streptomyces sp. NPDC002838]|uniref:hypothetical protein n=1 Tax=Streptomyces sp. NPDC002838 TaxID=3154436 RepID=UPI00331BD6C1
MNEPPPATVSPAPTTPTPSPLPTRTPVSNADYAGRIDDDSSAVDIDGAPSTAPRIAPETGAVTVD